MPGSSQSGSRNPLLERLSASLTGDHDAPVGHHPRDGAADQGMTGELGIAIPDRPRERKGKLFLTPDIDVDKLPEAPAAQ